MKPKVMEEGDTALRNFERTMKAMFKTPKAAMRRAKAKRPRTKKTA